MSNIKILWADDEIDLLKPQLFFLEKKGYTVDTVTNGHDAIERFETENDFDVVFLDESMPGLTGLETLTKIKQVNGSTPVVMITKNEAENLMEEAIGSQIDDYLIKPVNPNQILLTLKKLTDNKRLVSEKTISAYQMEFRKLLMEIGSDLDYAKWVDIYKKIISWELRLDESNITEMGDILAMQKNEANASFFKFIQHNYLDWLKGNGDGPTMSHQLMSDKVLPIMDSKRPTVFVLFDNLRFDQWKIIEPIISEFYRINEEDYFYSMIPTSTQYSRNAIFSGLLPSEIEQHYPDMWVNDHENKGKNLHEEDLFERFVKRRINGDLKWQYYKVTNVAKGKMIEDQAMNFLNNDLTLIVYNFIDMLSHARTEMEVLKELAGDEKAYRSLTRSWFVNSSIWNVLRALSEKDIQLIITTDHGTIRVKNPAKVVGDRDTTTNLRYKTGRNLKFSEKDVFYIKNPNAAGLPKVNMSSSYIFAKEDKFFLYPNNYNHYNKYYNNSFQHGGISLEEIICPFVELSPK